MTRHPTNRAARILCAVKDARKLAKTARQLDALGFAAYAVQARKLAQINLREARQLRAELSHA